MQREATALLVAVLAVAGEQAAAGCARPDGVDVAVGIREAPPFITDDPIRGRRGLNVELWSSIERELQAEGKIGKTAFVACPLGEQLGALAAGTLDVVISPLTITAERMERFDFTHQYLSSGITVVRRAEGGIDFRYATGILRKTVGQRGVPAAIGLFLAANLGLAMALRWALRREAAAGAGEVRQRVLGGLAVETVVRTVGLKGMGDARSAWLRALEIFMAVVGAVLSATVFGVLTTALVGSIGGSRDLAVGDLPALRVATLVDSTSQAMVEELLRAAPVAKRPAPVIPIDDHRLERVSQSRRPVTVTSPACVPRAAADPGTRCVTAAAWGEAMAMLASGEVDAVVGDWAQLSYLARLPEYADAVSVQAAIFRLEPYGWGVSARRPELRAAIDRALVQRLRSPAWRGLVQGYLGTGSISPE
ncbi:MAG: transporter substrate-binding domain-containing protein [Amaricoccus sp.]